MVRPAVSKLSVAQNGAPWLAAASSTAPNSSTYDMVSAQMTSAPPSIKAAICSSKAAAASA